MHHLFFQVIHKNNWFNFQVHILFEKTISSSKQFSSFQSFFFIRCFVHSSCIRTTITSSFNDNYFCLGFTTHDRCQVFHDFLCISSLFRTDFVKLFINICFDVSFC